MFRYKIFIRTGLSSDAEVFTAYASSTRVAINETLKRHWKKIAFKDLPPGDGMLFSIDIENVGKVYMTGRFAWKHEGRGGRPGFIKWATDKGWRKKGEIPDGHAILNKKNNYGYSDWLPRDGFPSGSKMGEMLDAKIAQEEVREKLEEAETVL